VLSVKIEEKRNIDLNILFEKNTKLMKRKELISAVIE
jgi:hypothetical protein